MASELKVRIYDNKTLEERLEQMGAKLTNETHFVDTYFKQPEDRVLKIVEKNTGVFLNEFQADNGQFRVIQDVQVDNPEEAQNQLTTQYGIKRVLKGKRKFFKLGNKEIVLNLIDEVGQFLVITEENPSKDFIENQLDITNPEYITVSFDELD